MTRGAMALLALLLFPEISPDDTLARFARRDFLYARLKVLF
jgi:hypothetical protein